MTTDLSKKNIDVIKRVLNYEMDVDLTDEEVCKLWEGFSNDNGTDWLTPEIPNCLKFVDYIIEKMYSKKKKVRNYIKKPVEIQAVQFTRDNINACLEFTNYNLRDIKLPKNTKEKMTGLIRTLESQHGLHTVQENDFIIKGIHGEFYPCKPDIFEKTYEEIK